MSIGILITDDALQKIEAIMCECDR